MLIWNYGDFTIETNALRPASASTGQARAPTLSGPSPAVRGRLSGDPGEVRNRMHGVAKLGKEPQAVHP